MSQGVTNCVEKDQERSTSVVDWLSCGQCSRIVRPTDTLFITYCCISALGSRHLLSLPRGIMAKPFLILSAFDQNINPQLYGILYRNVSSLVSYQLMAS